MVILVENISINRAHVHNFIQGAFEISDKTEDLPKSCSVSVTPQSFILYTSMALLNKNWTVRYNREKPKKDFYL